MIEPLFDASASSTSFDEPGSEYTGRLPAEVASLAVHPGIEPAPPGVAGIARRVLIVDDNHDAAESLAMLVELLGCETQVCYDGVAALAAVGDFKPDVILLDLSMPGLSGYEVARRLRALKAPLEARLIALSGRAEDDYRRQSEAAGFDDHLVKPVDIDTLFTALGAPPA